ncbi:CidA/LrgA family protein [Caldalkalibacillus thermarum]|nr:CidA/LrgA family protein [Caldalkalibacillus thermarum]
MVILRVIYQFVLIVGVYVLGTLVVHIFKLPLPGSMVGMLLLFLALWSGMMKLEWVEQAADLHLKHMTLFFIPPIVGIMYFADVFLRQGITVLLVIMISSVCVLLGTAYTVELADKWKRRR